MKMERKIADLVQKERAAVGHFELSHFSVHSPGEGALLVPEDLTLDQRIRESRTVQRYIGPFTAFALFVHGTGE